MSTIKMRGNEPEMFNALKLLVGELKAIAIAALANLRGDSVQEWAVEQVDACLNGCDTEILHPWFLETVGERPPCDRGKAGLERYLKHLKMTREDFEKAAKGELEGWDEREAKIASEWLERVRREEARSRSRKVGGLLRQHGITVRESKEN
jgi:hypothetical protein